MTKTGNTLRVAFRAIGRNKLRSLLTMLGIIIGVACVVATISIGEGARMQIESQLRALGTNFLMVYPGTTTSSCARTGRSCGSGINHEKVCTECSQLTLDLHAGAFADADGCNDASHTDDDAEHGQQRSQLISADCSKRDPQSISRFRHCESLTTFPSRSRILRCANSAISISCVINTTV